MNALKYPHLFEPIVLGKTIFKNRIFAAPTGFMSQDRFGVLPLEAAYYYGRKAKGGAASVALGEMKVDSEYGCQSIKGVHLDDPMCHPAISRVVEEVSLYGAVCTAELSHCGSAANSMNDPPGIAYGPVEGEENGHHFYEMPEEMIERVIRKFADGARIAKSLGFGMVMVHGGHGWLISQFLSPTLNTRTDRWGGPSIKNRARLAVEILKAVREAVGPGFPIEFRMSAEEGFEGGYDIEEGIVIARLAEPYVDLLHVSTGSHEKQEVFTVTHPSMFLPDGCNVYLAQEIKKHVSCKVATVGALADPGLMEEIIASGKADVVEAARAFLADPDIVRKMRTGQEDRINTCMRCLACFSNLINTGHFRCAINPQTGKEIALLNDSKAAVKKKILIAGGGIAGMQAAITGMERGHEVILCEASGELGGALRCEEQVPFKRRLTEYIGRQADRVRELGADVRLYTRVDGEYLSRENADVVIAALGARPVKLPLPGIDGPNVFGAEEIYYHPEKTGHNVLILGAGLVGTELSVYLSMLGRRVTIAEMLGEINTGGNFMHGWALQGQIEKYGIRILFHTAAQAVTEGGAMLKPLDQDAFFFPADTVIYATGQKPLWEEAAGLARFAADFHMIGDVLKPKNIMNASAMADQVIRSIG